MKISTLLFAALLTILFISCDKEDTDVAPSTATPAPTPSSLDYRDSVLGTYTCAQYRMFYMMPDTLIDTTYQNVSLVITKDASDPQNIVLNSTDTVPLDSNFSVYYYPLGFTHYIGQFFLAQDSVSLRGDYSSMAAHSLTKWDGGR